jgi:hypothetical protein
MLQQSTHLIYLDSLMDATTRQGDYPQGDMATKMPCYDDGMKAKNATKQVRISLKHYELIRRLAFRLHKPMSAVLEEIINARP